MKRSSLILAILCISLTGTSCTSVFSVLRDEGADNKKVVEPDEEELKKHAEVISRFYGKLNILSLDQIPEEKYVDYKKYVNSGVAYVVVHPSYYVFFHNYNQRKVVIEREKGMYAKNIVDIFIDEYPAGSSSILKNMKESEGRERAFLKKASSKRRLLILVLPLDYQNHPEYPYRGLDEYARYLNEVTGAPPSVVYIESASYKHGSLTFDTLVKLNMFLQAVGVKTLLLGGGYIDLCQKEFQEEAKKIQHIERVEVLREISLDSPDYMDEAR